MKRVLLFVATNLAIMLVLGVVLSVFGITSGTDPVTGDLDLTSLLIFAAVIGMGGSFISLAMSHPPLEERIAALQAAADDANDGGAIVSRRRI